MALEPNTLAEVKAQMQVRFPRWSSEFDTQVDTNMESWLYELSDYPYWFLTISPGDLLTTASAPINLAGLPNRGPSGSQWVDAGWLRTVNGQAVYDFYHPLDLEQYQAAPTTAAWFQPCKIQLVDYVLEFDQNKNFVNFIPVMDMMDALGSTPFLQNNRPMQAIWRKSETKSSLIFQPTPNAAYLYAVQFVLSNPPIYNSGGQNYNRWLTFCPEAVVLYGLMKAAEHFQEPQLQAKYEEELYGTPPKGMVHKQAAKPGILGRLKKETAKQKERMYQKLRWYESQTEAVGRQGLHYPGPQSRLRFVLPQYRSGFNF